MDNDLIEYFQKLNDKTIGKAESSLEHIRKLELLKTKYYKQLHDFNYLELFPCFFTGDWNLENPITILSINPKLDKKSNKTPDPVLKKKLEQGKEFNGWLKGCTNGFQEYLNHGRNLHSTWTCLYKVFNSGESDPIDRVKFFQENVVNIDWCYYYSSEFPTINRSYKQPKELLELYDEFDDNIDFLISQLKSKIIFAHGKSLSGWFEKNVTDRKVELNLEHNHKYQVFSGKYADTGIPVVYCKRGITWVGSDLNFAKIRNLVLKLTPNLPS